MIIQEKTMLNDKNTQPKSMLIAYLLLIFLGTLGLHRFYTNQIPSAITLLVLSVISLALPFMWVVVSVWLIYDLFSTNDNVNTYNKNLQSPLK